ncbi:D-2-hydroxyglutarate dehydrogenase, mitochondrial [Hordeum vulgare]|nr:D-2-hydroxyglutarate dehydrogenase, mitochondrial [Hordeum vulgare]
MPSAVFTTGLNINHNYSSPTHSVSPTTTLHRGILPFVHGSAPQFNNINSNMDKIITNGSVIAASSLGFRMQDEALETAIDMEDVERDDAKEEEPSEVKPSAKGGMKKQPTNAKPGEPRVKWMPKEDKCLTEAWKTVSIDPITGTNQNSNTYWRRIKTVFDEWKLVGPEFASIHMDRSEKAMANHWATIQKACNKWHDNNDQDFKFLHVFIGIELCEKLTECLLTLAKAMDGV